MSASRVAETRRCGGRLWSDTGGAAAVEFALVFPLLLVIMFGIFEFGGALHRYAVITDAAREGARRAVVKDGLTGTAKLNAVVAAINTLSTSAGLSAAVVSGDPMAACPTTWTPPSGTQDKKAVRVSGCGWAGATGTEARVMIQTPFPFEILQPLLSVLPGSSTVGPVTLTSSSVMRNE